MTEATNGETGAILDLNFNVYQNNIETQNVYSIFENIQKAKDFVESISTTHQRVEFIIYNSKQEVVEFIKAKSFS